jgi:VanZ family protein
MTSSENQTRPRRHDLLWRFVPLILWVAVIFVLSSSQGSFNETSRIIRPLLEFLFPAASPETITLYHGIVRKFAHFAEYAVLGFLAMRAFVRSWPITSSLVLIVAVAVVDETSQSFDPSRTGSGLDVMIDLTGGAAAIAFVSLLRARRKLRSR